MSGRLRIARTKKMIETLREKVNKDLKISTKYTAKNMNVSVSSMKTIFKNDLQLSTQKMRKRHYFTPAPKCKKFERVKIILGELKAGMAEREIVFYDEKIFTVELTVNNQNDRVYAKSSAYTDDSPRTVYCRQKPFILIMWSAVSFVFLCYNIYFIFIR